MVDMNKWYLCKVSYERQADSMGLKKVTEGYLVDALSFTEAEARIVNEVTPLVSVGVLEVVNIRPMRFSELLLDGKSDKYYRAKVDVITIDSGGREHKESTAMLVQANSLLIATKELIAHLGGLPPYELVSIAELDILDVYRYIAPEEQ
jgi:hypothetical protein|nr:MAG TPA: protein of unknown function (DUF4494) [Caudoviricetes sp.]